ncbi:tail length tape-measure protein [Streptococcus phage Javan253]|uniref:hypothetical protein n=1 Tax=Streptococcus henryi TaxID=439219 RepID=UPI00036273C2|nr:hypothetical protein [Streptococcus henryi]QBX16508.1 tail length tape-measure protein [Streptococcus phage Javan253]
MATTLEQLRVIIDGEIAPFKKKMKEASDTVKQSQSKIKQSTDNVSNTIKQSTNGIGQAFGRLAKILSFAYIGKKMLDLGMYSTQMALEVTAAMNQLNRQMGESTQSFLKWIDKNANAMNMSIADATKYGSVYSNLFSNFIKDSEKLSAYTGKMLQTSAVIAQGTGRTMTDVMERIRSGLLGNTEAIEDLGINVNVAMIESTEAFRKYAGDSSWQQLDYNTQQQIRLMAILEQASAKYGDTLQSSVNGRISLFKSLLSDAALNIGNAFLPILNAVMPVLNSLAMALKNVTAKLAEFVGLMFNKKASVKDGAMGQLASGAGTANDAVGDLGDAMDGVDDASGGTADNLDDTAKSAKKAAKELLGLAGFDEITTLSLNKDDGSGSGGSGGKGGKGGKGGGSGSGADILPEIELTDMDNQFKSIFDGWDKKLKPLLDYLSKLKDLFKDGFNASFRTDSLDRFKKALDGIWKSLKDIFEDGTVLQAAARFGERLAYALGQTAGAIANVVMGIAVFIAESLNKSLNETKLDIKGWLIRQFDIAGDVISHIGNIAQTVGQIFYDTITSTPATDIGSHIISAFTYVGMGIAEVGSKYIRDAFGSLDTILSENQEKITEALTGILSAAEPIFRSIKDLIKNTFETFNKVYDEHIKPFMDSFGKGISDIVGAFLDSWNTNIKPVLDDIGKAVADMFDNHIQPMIDMFLEAMGSVIDVIKLAWENVIQPFVEWFMANILPVLMPTIKLLIDFVVESINMLADYISGLLEIIKGIADFIVGVFTGDWELAWTGIKEIFSGFTDSILALVEYLWNMGVAVFEWAWDTIIAIIKAGWDGIVRIFSPIGQWFSDRWNDIVKAFKDAGQWFKQKFDESYKNVQNAFSGIGGWFKSRYNDTTNAFSNVGSWFGSTFRGAWSNVTNAFSGVANFFKGIYNTIKNSFSNIGVAIGSAVSGAFRSAMNAAFYTVENAVNTFIGMINGVIGVINKLPGVSLGHIGRVYIPKLARGGIVDNPTLAMIGEAGKEAVVPLENTGFLQTMGRVVSSAVVTALGGGNYQSQGFGDGDIIINIGGSEFGRIAIKEINKEQARAGQILLNI